MRDINRIEILLEKFKELWLLYPDLRLFQTIILLYNDCDLTMDPFYIEDDQWLKLIQNSIDKAEKM